MRYSFRESRQEVANDLRAVSHAWREFTADRHVAEPQEPAPEHKPVVETVHAAAPQRGKKPQPTKEHFGTTKPKGRRK